MSNTTVKLDGSEYISNIPTVYYGAMSAFVEKFGSKTLGQFLATATLPGGTIISTTINLLKDPDNPKKIIISTTLANGTTYILSRFAGNFAIGIAELLVGSVLSTFGVAATPFVISAAATGLVVVGTILAANELQSIIYNHFKNLEDTMELFAPNIYGKITKEEFILKELESSNGNFCKKIFPEYARYVQTRDWSKVDISTVSNSDFIQRITLENNKNALAIKTASEVGSVKQATEIFEIINAMPNIPTVTINSHTYDIRNLSNLEIRNTLNKIPQMSFLTSDILIRTGEELDLGSKGIYKVKSGDTLSTIAKKTV